MNPLPAAIKTELLEELLKSASKIPSVKQLNARLLEHGVPFQIVDGELRRVQTDAVISAGPIDASSVGMPYQIGDVLGQGGYGVVYRATRQTSVATFEFALKVLDPSVFVATEKALPRFQREVRAVQTLQHRAIVPYVDAGVDAKARPYLVMPLISGRDIRTATEGAEPSMVVSLMAEVLHGLDHAHSSGVLHRDLKPSKILVRTSDMQPIILDFGTAFILDDADTKSLTTAAVGSIGYIPSEVLADPKVRSTSQDVFACAVLTYERHRHEPSAEDHRQVADHHRGNLACWRLNGD
jgi:serine/threonine protein kinase